MESNIGSGDRVARVIGGVALLAGGIATLAGVLAFGPAAGAVAAVIGAVFLGTALTRFCLVYRVLGVDTCNAT